MQVFIDRFDLEYTILTGGATFSTITAKNGEVSTLLTPHVEVADTVGAGDSFSGSFTGKLLSGAPLREAHRAAVNTAAYVCTKEGGWQPTLWKAFRIISPKPASKPDFPFIIINEAMSAIMASFFIPIFNPQLVQSRLSRYTHLNEE